MAHPLTSYSMSEELLALVRAGGCLEQAAGAAAEVGQIDPAALRLLGQPLREVERVVEALRAAL